MSKSVDRIFPSVNAIEKNNENILLSLTINADLKCFKGHFDDVAVVPGVVQLDWAIHYAKEKLLVTGDVLDVSVLKFQKLMLPDMEVKLEIIKKSANKFNFTYFNGEDKFSSARVELA